MNLVDLTNKDIFETLINSGASEDELSEWCIELFEKLGMNAKIETFLYLKTKVME